MPESTVCNFIKEGTHVFSVNFCEIGYNRYFKEHLQAAACETYYSDFRKKTITLALVFNIYNPNFWPKEFFFAEETILK